MCTSDGVMHKYVQCVYISLSLYCAVLHTVAVCVGLFTTVYVIEGAFDGVLLGALLGTSEGALLGTLLGVSLHGSVARSIG